MGLLAAAGIAAASCTPHVAPCALGTACVLDGGTCAPARPTPLLFDHVGVLRSGEVVGVGREAFSFVARLDLEALTLLEPRSLPVDAHVRDGLLSRIDEEGRLLVAERFDAPWEVRGPVPPHAHELVIGEGIWLASGEEPGGRVHRSLDEGRTWVTRAGSGLDPRSHRLVGAQGRRVWAASAVPTADADRRMLFRSEDEGETFAPLGSRVIDGAWMPLPGVLFASTPSGECLRSDDGGDSWRDSTARCSARSRFVRDGDHVFVDGGGIARSDDGGVTFETSETSAVLVGAVGGRGFFQLAERVWVWGEDEVLWSPVLERPSRLFVREAYPTGIAGVLYVHAVRETEAGAHSVVLRTDDGGRTFREVLTVPYPASGPILAVASRDHFAFPGGMGWAITTDGGVTFRSLGPHFTQFTSAPSRTLWAIESDVRRFVVRWGGEAWTRVAEYDVAETSEILVVDARDRPLLISISGGAMRLETDGTWSRATPEEPCVVGLTPALDVLTPPDGRVLFRCHRGAEVLLAELDADDTRVSYTRLPGLRTSDAMGEAFERLVIEPSGVIDLVLSHSESTRVLRVGSEPATLRTALPIATHAAFVDGEDLVLVGDASGCDAPRVEHVALSDLAEP